MPINIKIQWILSGIDNIGISDDEQNTNDTRTIYLLVTRLYRS